MALPWRALAASRTLASVPRCLVSSWLAQRTAGHPAGRKGPPLQAQGFGSAVVAEAEPALGGLAVEEHDTGATGFPTVIETKGVPIHVYAPVGELESEAIEQLRKLAESPMPVGYVAGMPDLHVGKGIAVGAVFASREYICPNAVGVDIGCGMCAVPMKGLHKDDLSRKQLQRIQAQVKARIPTGPNSHQKALPHARHTLDDISHAHRPSKWLEERSAQGRVAAQVGTLGGGNHFIEVLHDETGQVWCMLHSGSRNVGNATAEFYDRLAKEQLLRQGISSKELAGLHYLRIDSEEGRNYLGDMTWNQEYAFQNRKARKNSLSKNIFAMLELLVDIVSAVGKSEPETARQINIHHNFCQCERCTYTDAKTGEKREEDLWVTRKGATPAHKGRLGLIPGSMGTGSFVTRGLGEGRSWSSSSHGAGRRMSRTKAKSSIDQGAFEAAMKGIVADVDRRVLDEAPQAYKDLTQVMANQRDLVEIQHRLLPILNVKGFK